MTEPITGRVQSAQAFHDNDREMNALHTPVEDVRECQDCQSINPFVRVVRATLRYRLSMGWRITRLIGWGQWRLHKVTLLMFLNPKTKMAYYREEAHV